MLTSTVQNFLDHPLIGHLRISYLSHDTETNQSLMTLRSVCSAASVPAGTAETLAVVAGMPGPHGGTKPKRAAGSMPTAFTRPPASSSGAMHAA